MAWPLLLPACSAGKATTAEPTAGLDEALAHATRLLETQPALAGEQAREIITAVGEHPMAVLILAVSHRLQGQLQHALDALRPLVASQPNWA